MSSALRRLLAGGCTVVLLVLGVQILGTASADAHANAVQGSSNCLSSNGTYTVTWTITNDYDLTETATVVTSTPSGSTLSAQSVNLGKSSGNPIAHITQSGIPGSATSAYLKVNGHWSDGFEVPNDSTVNLSGTCLPGKVPSTPTYTNGACVDFAVTKPTLTIPQDSGVTYTVNGSPRSAGTFSVTAGDYTIVASSITYTLTPPTSWPYHVTEVSGDCLTTVSPVNPDVAQSVCAGHNPTQPSVTLPTTTGIHYTATPSANYQAGQSVTIDAYALTGNKFVSVPADWTKLSDTHAQKTFTLHDAPDCTEGTTPVLPTVHESVCSGHTPTLPTLDLATTKGIDYTVSKPGPYAAGQTVTVTATLQSGFKWASFPSEWTQTSATQATKDVQFAAAPDCREAVTPVNPDVSQSVCTGVTPTAPDLSFKTTPGITYSANPLSGWTAGSTAIVTATATDGFKFVTVPADWTKVDDTHATRSVVFSDAPDCREVVNPVSPDVSQSVCSGHFPTAPGLSGPADTASVHYMVSPEGPFAVGTSTTVTATAQKDAKFAASLPAPWVRQSDTVATDLVTFTAAPDCRATTTPVNPGVTQSVCAETGTTPVPPSLTLPANTVEIVYSVLPAAGWAAGDTAVVTATAQPGYKFATDLPDRWTQGATDSIATYSVVFDVAPTCVVPVAPGLTQSACAATGTTPVPATLTLPPTSPGVTYVVTGTVGAGLPVTVTATAAAGYQFDTGVVAGWVRVSDTEETFDVTFDAAPSCAETVAPTFTNDVCVSFAPTAGSYTIADTTGVDYYVDSVLTAPGTYTATDGSTITVEAKPQAGFTLVGTTSWTQTFTVTPTCTQSQQATKATFAAQQCVTGSKLTPGSYTVPTSTGVDYLVNGKVVAAGTYTASPSTSVTVTAQAKPGFTLKGASSWTFKFASAKQCSNVLPTSVTRPPSTSASGSTSAAPHGPLAVTGVQSSSLLTYGVGLLVVGIAVTLLASVTRRRRTDGPRH